MTPRQNIVSLVLLAAGLVVAGVMLLKSIGGFGAAEPDPVPPDDVDDAWLSGPCPPELPEVESPIRFTALSPEEHGIVFEYFGGPTARNDMTEQNGGGIAVLDHDLDGVIDLFFTNGSRFGNPGNAADHSQRLYHATGPLKFDDVTRPARLEAFGFGQGCVAADYDNDGFSDLFVAAYGENRLWHNNGDGTFTDVTDEAGLSDDRWSTSAAFADLDGDGNLDLYVVNYVDWAPGDSGQERIPTPMNYRGIPDRLYRNAGNGQFERVGEAAGIAIPDDSKGLALAIADLNGDGRLDVYVANDTRRNFLFLNQGEFQFEERGIPLGVAVSQDGSIGSSMGVAVADYNCDSGPDLFVTNFGGELLDVFAGLGSAGFVATNSELGVDPVSRPLLNFGVVAADFDLDFWPDLFFANGHLWDEAGDGSGGRMRQTLMWNQHGQRFVDVTSAGGPYFSRRWLARSVAAGDLDHDGDTDLVVGHLLDRSAILRNDSTRAGDSVRVAFIGTVSSRQPLGCRVVVQIDERQSVATTVPAGGSFQASHDPVLVVPVGDATRIAAITIVWPSGRAEAWTDLAADNALTLIQGTGVAPTETSSPR